MAQYKKLSDYTINAAPNDGDLVPLIIDNGDDTYDNALMRYDSLKGTPGTNGSDGQGVPTGGTTGQVLQKVSGASFDTAWVTMTISKSAVGLGNVDNTSDLNKPVSTATQAAIDAAVLATKQALYPVGSIYTNATNNTNPATLLGFGTWVAFSAGRVPVGYDSTQTEFDTAEETGGSKTVTISQANLPNLQGSIKMHSTVDSTNIAELYGVFSSGYLNNAYRNGGSGGAGPQSHGIINFNLNSGTQTAVNNLQPYITVYMWKRTA